MMNRIYYTLDERLYVLDYTGDPVLPENAIEVDESTFIARVAEIEDRNNRIRENRQQMEDSKERAEHSAILARAEKVRGELLLIGLSIDSAEALASVVGNNRQ